MTENATGISPYVETGISSIASAGAGIYTTKMQNEANQKMAEYSHSKDLEMWHRANEYNSPAAQMGRLKEAGLNPNLVYGKGTQTQGASQLPKYNAPRMDYSQIATGIQSGIQQISQFMTLKKLGAEINYIDANTNARQLQSNIFAEQAKKAGLDVKLFQETYADKISQSNLDVQQTKAGINNLREINKNLKVDNKVKSLQAQAITKKISLDEFEIQLNKHGVTKQDSKLMRMLINAIQTDQLSGKLITPFKR